MLSNIKASTVRTTDRLTENLEPEDNFNQDNLPMDKLVVNR